MECHFAVGYFRCHLLSCKYYCFWLLFALLLLLVLMSLLLLTLCPSMQRFIMVDQHLCHLCLKFLSLLLIFGVALMWTLGRCPRCVFVPIAHTSKFIGRHTYSTATGLPLWGYLRCMIALCLFVCESRNFSVFFMFPLVDATSSLCLCACFCRHTTRVRFFPPIISLVFLFICVASSFERKTVTRLFCDFGVRLILFMLDGFIRFIYCGTALQNAGGSKWFVLIVFCFCFFVFFCFIFQISNLCQVLD